MMRAAFKAGKVFCEYCGVQVFRTKVRPTHPQRATIDHRIPLAWGGHDGASNKAIVCFRCNQAKGSRLTEYEFRQRLAQWALRAPVEGEPQP